MHNTTGRIEDTRNAEPPTLADRPGPAPASPRSALSDLIYAYRRGSTPAAEELLRRFAPLMGKYAALLLHGRYRTDDGDVRSFLGLFLGARCADAAPELLCRTLRSVCEPEDLQQELALALLETCRKYTAIAANYRYVLAYRLRPLVFSDELMTHERMQFASEAVQAEFLEAVPPREPLKELDDAWVEGTTESERFASLTPTERRILRAIYLRGARFGDGRCAKGEVSNREVAQELAIPYRTYQRLKASAIAKLAARFPEPPPVVETPSRPRETADETPTRAPWESSPTWAHVWQEERDRDPRLARPLP